MTLSEHERDALDETKGILIVLIVLGHNTILMNASPFVRVFLYDWHVYGFFLVSFLLPFRAGERGFLVTRLVRYAVPFLVFLVLAWLAHLIQADAWRRPGEAVGALILAASIGSADLLDTAAGARLFWFLPALMGLVLVRWLLERARWPARGMKIGLAGLFFATVGLLPEAIARYIPLGLPIALYLLFPGMIFAAAVSFLMDGGTVRRGLALAVALGLLVATTWLARIEGTRLILAQFWYHHLAAPVALINHALLAMSATGALVLACVMLPAARWLKRIGQLSLMIYLSHQFVYVPLLKVARRVDPEAVAGHSVPLGLALLAATLFLSGVVALTVDRVKALRRFLAPRDWRDWRDNFRGLPPRGPEAPALSQVRNLD